MYEKLRQHGSPKVLKAISEGNSKTTTNSKQQPITDPTHTHASSSTDPMLPPLATDEDEPHGVVGADEHVYEDVDTIIEGCPAPGKYEESNTLQTTYYAQLIDILQVLGVDCVQATRFACSLKGAPKASFVEAYGKGNLNKLAHEKYRDLNVEGLGAFDVRAQKPGGGHWDVNLTSDQEEANAYVVSMKPL